MNSSIAKVVDVGINEILPNRFQPRLTFKDEALKRIKYRLILEEIIKAEKIEATDKEVEDKLNEMAKQYNMTKEEIKKQYGDNLDYLSYDIKVHKAFDIIKK